MILVIYSPSLMQEPYNVSQEMERKRAQSLILSQTKQQERRDEEVFFLPLLISIIYMDAIIIHSEKMK